MNTVTIGDALLPQDDAPTARCRRFLYAHLAPSYAVPQGFGFDHNTTGEYDLESLRKVIVNFRGTGKELRAYSRTDAQLVFGHQDGLLIFHIIERLLKAEIAALPYWKQIIHHRPKFLDTLELFVIHCIPLSLTSITLLDGDKLKWTYVSAFSLSYLVIGISISIARKWV